MARQLVKYRLNVDGTIPDFLETSHEVDGLGGAFPVIDLSTPSPQDLVMLGITVDNPSGDFEVISSQADLSAYLTTVGADWTQPDPSDPTNLNAVIPFDADAAAAAVWAKLTALNAV